MKQKLEIADWQMKRDIFEALIKRVEISADNVNVVFRVSPYPPGSNSINHSGHLLDDCRSSRDTGISNQHFFNSLGKIGGDGIVSHSI